MNLWVALQIATYAAALFIIGERLTRPPKPEQPAPDTLNEQRIIAKGADWMRAGRELYKREAIGDYPVKPSDIIRTAEDPRPRQGRNANICAAEGCFGRACEQETKP